MTLIDTVVDIKDSKLSYFNFLRQINTTIYTAIERLIDLELMKEDERYNIYDTQQDDSVSRSGTLAVIWYLDTINKSFRVSLKAINCTRPTFTIQISRIL